jgi:hypothetical protein
MPSQALIHRPGLEVINSHSSTSAKTIEPVSIAIVSVAARQHRDPGPAL